MNSLDKSNQSLDESQAAIGTDISVETVKMYTIDEMAAQCDGITPRGLLKRLEVMGIEPVKPSEMQEGKGRGRGKALYSQAQFTQVLDQHSSYVQKKQELITKEVAKTSLEAKVQVVEDAFKLAEDDDDTFMAMMAKVVQTANARVAKAQEEKRILKEENERLALHLEIKEGTGTLEKWNELEGWGFDAVQLSQMSRMLGHIIPREKIITVEHIKGVWTYKIDDVRQALKQYPGIIDQVNTYKKKL